MTSYRHLAAVYDQLMEEAPADLWLDWMDNVLREGLRPGATVIDLGCGTGSIAIPLALRGYRVIGVDLSADMLAVAYEKMRQSKAAVTWVEQDMRQLSATTADLVISFCDALNYLREEDDVRMTFQRVYAHLCPGGFFLFDMHSPYKVTEVFGNHTFTYLDEEVNYIWQCFLDPHRLEVEHELTFFLRQPNGLYQRLEEAHVQRAYQPHQIVSWLREAGFAEIVMTADFRQEPPVRESERLFFAARRPKR